MRQADGPPPGVAPEGTEGPQEGDRPGRGKPGLLPELAARPVLDRLLDFQESPREGPMAGEGVVLAPDEEDPEPVGGEGEDRQVDGDGRAWIIVTVGRSGGLPASVVLHGSIPRPSTGRPRPRSSPGSSKGPRTLSEPAIIRQTSPSPGAGRARDGEPGTMAMAGRRPDAENLGRRRGPLRSDGYPP